jgi:hypothetical protein
VPLDNTGNRVTECQGQIDLPMRRKLYGIVPEPESLGKGEKSETCILPAPPQFPSVLFSVFWIFDSREAFAAAPFAFPANGSGII